MIGNDQIGERDLQRYRTTLEDARRRFESGHRAGEEELDAIEAEREIEREELAQEEQTADVRTRVVHNQFAQIRQIDGALERLERGEYGLCIDCGKAIPRERLDAQPWASTCAECAAERREADERHRDDPADRPQDRRMDVPDDVPDEETQSPPLPAEVALLEDEEVAATIRETFRTEVGEALEDVRIACCDGVVTLAGEVPNEALPEVARHIVEDELGFEVVDRMLVIDTAGGPEREADEATPPSRTAPADTLNLGDEEMEGEISDDIHETEEEGLVFVPPSRPIPER